MREQRGVPLADLTTLRVGGPASRVVEVETDDEAVEVVREADRTRQPVLVLGGGSNLLVSDGGIDATVVAIRTRGVEVERSGDEVAVTAAAGEPWDDLVARTVHEGWSGLEALSGIPGLTGATPIQNVGAYGQEVAQTVRCVTAYDRYDRVVRELSAGECGFGYRTSRFKTEPRYVVLSVTFGLFDAGRDGTGQSGESRPVAYAELARRLGIEVGETAPASAVRAAVLDLRRGKGMVLDADDPDTWSAGSFFTNPILEPQEAERLPVDAPRWPAADGRVKTSAAWLIEHAGFSRGFGEGPARLSTKHTLALTNRGDAKAEDLLALARQVRDGVLAAFGVRLVNEPVLVGVEL